MTKILKIFSVVFISFIIFFGILQYYSGLMFDESNCKVQSLWNLRKMRHEIKEYYQDNDRYPFSIAELKKYAMTKSSFYERGFAEYLSNPKGNSNENNSLTGSGGWYYDKTTGTLKINLTKPLKTYLRRYIADDKNEIPSNW